MSPWKTLASLAVAGLFLGASTASADSVADFYKGKDISLFVGSAPGGGYDTTARLLARHYSKHIPGNPNIIIRNMPGAGSLAMTNHVANIAPKDGTALGAPQNTVPLERLLHILSPEGKNANFDAQKLNWLGTTSQEVFLLLAWHATPVDKFEDLMTTEMIVGSSGHNTDHSITARLLNNVFGTKLKVVTGYGSSNEILLAMERGEVQGNSGRAYSSLLSTWPDAVRDKKVKILLQMGMQPHPDLPDVPSATKIAKTEADRAVLELVFSKYRMSRPYFVPAGVPKERIDALRRAFDATMKDPEFLKDAQKQQIEVDPVTGEEVQALLDRLFQTPEVLVAKAREMLKTQE